MSNTPDTNRNIQVPFQVSRTEERDNGLTLEGYAAVFDEVTRIDSWEGRFDEKIAPGAFSKTISERTPVLQFDHGQHPTIGSIPIGSIQVLREDSRGLFVRATLHDNWLIEPVRQAIQSGSIDGMSFRFQVMQEKWDERAGDVPERTITEVRLHELGPVVFPAYEQTTVGVRSAYAALDKMFADPEMQKAFAQWLAFGSQEASRTGAPEGAADEAPQAEPAAPATVNPARVRQLREKAQALTSEGK